MSSMSKWLLAMLLCVPFLGSSALGGDEPMDTHLRMSAATDFTGMHPGDSGILAITLNIDDGWHTYWPGVSDSGYGFTLGFDTPESITLGEPIWPTPKRHLQKGDILDHVYEDSPMILVPFTLAADAEIDDVIAIGISAKYLICDQVCLPEQVGSTASFTVVEPTNPVSASSASQEIHRVYEARPKPFNPASADVRVQWIAKGVAIMFRDASRIEFFPGQDCTELADPITQEITDSNRLEIQFTAAADKRLSGRLRVTEPSGIVEYDIDLNAPNHKEGVHHP